MTPKELGTLSKIVVDQTKKGVTSEIKKQITEEKNDKRKEAQNYLLRLKDESIIAFQELRERPPGTATDAQLLVLLEGFQGSRHRPSAYKDALSAKLARFQASGVNKIGRDWAWRKTNETAVGANYSAVVRDRMVVKVVFKSGRPTRYAYANNDWAEPRAIAPGGSDVSDESLPMNPETFRGQQIPKLLRLGRREFDSFIEPEFEGVAVERHLQVWGKEPETITAEDSNWAFLDAWPGTKAGVSKPAASQAGPPQNALPRLQLGQPAQECKAGDTPPEVDP